MDSNYLLDKYKGIFKNGSLKGSVSDMLDDLIEPYSVSEILSGNVIGIPKARTSKNFRPHIEGYMAFYAIYDYFRNHEALHQILYLHLGVILRVLRLHKDLTKNLGDVEFQTLMYEYGLELMHALIWEKHNRRLDSVKQDDFSSTIIKRLNNDIESDYEFAAMLEKPPFGEENSNDLLTQSNIDWLLESLGTPNGKICMTPNCIELLIAESGQRLNDCDDDSSELLSKEDIDKLLADLGDNIDE
jgi:hypothetical protein